MLDLNDLKKSDFYYELPEELIAQTPVEPRNSSRLMVIDRKTGARGLRAIMEDNLLELMYDIPDKKNVVEIVIDEHVINDKKAPKFILNKADKKAS